MKISIVWRKYIRAKDVIIQVDQIDEVVHFLQAIGADHLDCSKTFMPAEGSHHTLGLVVVILAEAVPTNADDISQLLAGTAYGHKHLCQNVKLY